MKNFTPLMFALLFSASQFVNAQCGITDQSNFITSQEALNALAGCEVFQGDLNITGADVTNLEALSSLVSVEGNLSIYETSISTIDPLGGLMNANEISIYNNEYLSACCALLEWQLAVDLGAIYSVTFTSNATDCNSYSEAQAACLGLIPGCTDPNAVNFESQATFDDGTCLNGIDLQVSVGTILQSLQVNIEGSQNDCLVSEGCFTGLGERKVLRFTTMISNYGNEDFIIGYESDENSQFYWDECHGHYHYEGYANYQIYDYPSLLESPIIGHKNGWCVMDLGSANSTENPWSNSPSCQFTYNCSYMGISAGCSDTYSSGIDCQWVDITDLSDGEYILSVTTNMETENYQPTPELDFSNNQVFIKFEISTTNGQTQVVSATEFDGSGINNICIPDNDQATLGFNFSDNVEVIDNVVQSPQAFFNEYYVLQSQVYLSDTILINSTSYYVDSLVVNEVNDLPEGLTMECYPDACSFLPGNSCFGIVGIPTELGEFETNFSSTLYVSNESGEIIELQLPNNDNNFSLSNFSPTLAIDVEMPVYGCTDNMALNFDSLATFEDGTCLFPNLGCTDPLSLNFDDSATVDDGSCDYCAEGIEYVAQLDMNDSYGDGWNGNEYVISTTNGDIIISGTLSTGYSGSNLFCLAPGCYFISVDGGNWQEEVSWEMSAFGFPDFSVNGGAPNEQLFTYLIDDCSSVEGCTDSTAFNYNPLAGTDNGSCEPVLLGCTSGDALNFDSNANTDDGSCISPVYGCTDTTAINHDLEANVDDGSCIFPEPCDFDYVILTLNDTYGDGWNSNYITIAGSNYSIPDANGDYTTTNYEIYDGGFSQNIALCIDLSSCIDIIYNNTGTYQEENSWSIVYNGIQLIQSGPEGSSIGDCNLVGCTDSLATNFNPIATQDDGSCDYVYGCTDFEALNFNPSAVVDDGTCEYFDCGEQENIVLVALQTDPHPQETSWDLTTDDGVIIYSSGEFEEQNTLHMDSVCVPNDIPITFNIYDTYGDGLTSNSGNGQFNVYVCGLQVFAGSAFNNLFSGTFFGCDGAQIIVFGCTDEAAINYSPDANTEDGSCEYEVVLGCTDEEAVNFNQFATQDDNSCEYITCEFFEMLVEINMFSTDGNGWGGLNYELSTFDNTLDETGTLATGFEGKDYYCLSDGCYKFILPEFGGQEYLSWSILIEGKKQVSGTTETKTHFGVNQICELVMGCTDPNAINFNPEANVSDESCNYPNGGTQLLALEAGWNMVSSFIQTENMSMETVMEPILSQVMIVKDNLGLAYLPDFNFNGIGDWENTQGYQLKLYDEAVIDMTGVVVEPEQTPINLIEGWNMIAYLRSEPASVDVILDAFTSDIIIVKDVLGMAYLPEWGFNGIGDMHAGQGYQIKLYASHELIYNANDDDYRMAQNPPVDNTPIAVDFEKNTGSNMHLLVPENAWNISVSSKDELYVYDAKGDMVGAAKITFPNTLITLWGNDLLTAEKDGLYDAEEWSLVLYSEESNTVHAVSLELKTGVSGYEKDALVIASQITESNFEKGLALYNSIPNPASNFTEISFYLNKEMDLTLRLFNVIGEEIKLMSAGTKSAGYHKAQVDLNQLAPGSYFYQLQADDAQITKRLEVIK